MSWFRRLLFWFYTLLGLEAVRLNLRISPGCRVWYFFKGTYMAKIGNTFTATIKPTNAAGASAPVTDVVWTAPAGYDVHVATDGLTAILVAVSAIIGASVGVTAKSKAGVALSGSAPLPDVDATPVDDEAVTLNLTVA